MDVCIVLYHAYAACSRCKRNSDAGLSQNRAVGQSGITTARPSAQSGDLSDMSDFPVSSRRGKAAVIKVDQPTEWHLFVLTKKKLYLFSYIYISICLLPFQRKNEHAADCGIPQVEKMTRIKTGASKSSSYISVNSECDKIEKQEEEQ